jgi:replicative DNA helicase
MTATANGNGHLSAPPQDLDAEQAVLGAVLLSDVALGTLEDVGLRPEHFYRASYGEIFRVMLALAGEGEPVDTLTVRDRLARDGSLDQVGGPAVVEFLGGAVPNVGAVRQYAAIVRRKARWRARLQVTYDSQLAAHDEDEDGWVEALARADDVDADRLARPAEPSEIFYEWYDGVKGFPTPFPTLTRALGGGLVAGDVTVVTTWPGGGKALDVRTPIRVPDGWKTMGDLRDGDMVYGSDGQPTRVSRAWPVMLGRPCRRLTFSDGSSIVCDEDHLWVTHTREARKSAASRALYEARCQDAGVHAVGYRPRVTPEARTAAMLGESLERGDYTHSIPTCSPLSGARADLPIDPYVLGLWLGDGTKRTSDICAGAQDLDHVVRQIQAAGEVPVVRRSRDVFQIRFGPMSFFGLAGCGKQRLRRLNLVENKHVPTLYANASFEQRLALMQGIMDSDGTAYPLRGRCAITLTLRKLAEDVLDLALGLGLRATMTEADAKLYGRVVGRKYKIGFTTSLPVFRLPRKAERLQQSVSTRATHRYLVAVEEVPSVPVRCITVEANDSLYLAGRSLIPTHNTVLVDQMVLHIKEQEPDVRAHIYVNELNLGVRTARMLARMTGVPWQVIRDRKMNHTQWAKVHAAWASFPSGYERISGWPVDDIARHIRRHGWDLCVIDSGSRIPTRDTFEVERVSGTIADVADKSGCHILLVLQLNLERVKSVTRPPPLGRDLLGGGSWYRDCRNMICIHRDQEVVQIGGADRARPLASGNVYADKATHGEPERSQVRVEFNPAMMRFDEIFEDEVDHVDAVMPDRKRSAADDMPF